MAGDATPRLLDTLRSQDVAVRTLARALASGKVHHAYLFDGPDGVGKELAAFGLAQALVCETPSPEGLACGACSACTRAVPRGASRVPVHPDVVVLEKGLYEPAQIGRRSPETQELSIDQVRTLVLARAAFPPHEGRARVFVIRRADELSTSAANALLKTLEEPLARTHFVLLTANPGELLATVRSRTQRLRFSPLPESVVAELVTARGVPAERAKDVARLARGSVSLATSLADEEAARAREAWIARAMDAAAAKTLGPALELGEEAKKDKGALPAHLEALALAFAEKTSGVAAGSPLDVERASQRYDAVRAALRQLDGNASAQLVVETMFIRMRTA
ncbi:MAG: DNA polymerase III subunit [Polyangiaceae bacterium]